MHDDALIQRERALRRIRLLVERVEEDCSLRHPQICMLRSKLDRVERPLTHADIVWLLDILHCTAADCPGNEHCELLRGDLENELKEFDA